MTDPNPRSDDSAEDVVDDDDAEWIKSLRDALAVDPDEVQESRPAFGFNGAARPTPPQQGHETQSPEPEADALTNRTNQPAPDLSDIKDSLRSLASRMRDLETLMEDMAARPSVPAAVPDLANLEAAITRTVQSQLTTEMLTPPPVSAGPNAEELAQIVTHVVRAELPALLKEHLAIEVQPTLALGEDTLDRWAERVDEGDGPSGDVVLLAHELRSRIGQLEQLQRQTVEQNAADRRALIDGAVQEIRHLLFGQ